MTLSSNPARLRYISVGTAPGEIGASSQMLSALAAAEGSYVTNSGWGVSDSMEGYSVVFEGCDASGDALIAVKAKLAAMLKLAPAQVERLCRARNVTVRQSLPREQAHRLVQKLTEIGVQARLMPGVPVSVAATTGHAPTGSATLTPQTLDQFFRGRLSRPKLTLSYRASLFAVSGLMVLLPLIYCAMLAAFAYAGVWYATHGPALLAGRVRGWVWLVAYIGPLVAAIGVCMAMLKPVVARGPRRQDSLVLLRSDEPLFFGFVEKICDVVGAPRPAQIQVNCAVNASAALQDGARGFFGGGLVLTVGMPLFAGLDTRQLAGVLAHEFGHFAQHAGMRAGYLVTHINGWLYRAVYLPDSWDEWLVRLDRRLDNRLWILILVERAASWCVRRMLWSLMWLGTVASRYLSRQMEFDADRYEALLAGSAVFRQTSYRFRLMGHAFHDVHKDLRESWQDRKLVKNLPHLAQRRARELEPTLCRHIESEMEQLETKYFDTHPADNDRVQNAERLKAPGIFAHAAPAHVLLRNYEKLAERTTWLYYRTELGLDVRPEQLVADVATPTRQQPTRQTTNA